MANSGRPVPFPARFLGQNLRALRRRTAASISAWFLLSRALTALVALSHSPKVFAGESFTTSIGAVFTQVEDADFGTAWRAPDGLLWSAYQGDFSNEGWSFGGDLHNWETSPTYAVRTWSAATKACARIGGNLPTVPDFERLKAFFEYSDKWNPPTFSAQGASDFKRLYPWKDAQVFWTSSVFPGHSWGASRFLNYGLLAGGSGAFDHEPYSVICVKGGQHDTELKGNLNFFGLLEWLQAKIFLRGRRL